MQTMIVNMQTKAISKQKQDCLTTSTSAKQDKLRNQVTINNICKTRQTTKTSNHHAKMQACEVRKQQAGNHASNKQAFL